jgi:hypothetical protein
MRTMMTALAGAGAVMLALGAGAEAAPVQWKVEDGGNGHWYEAVFVSGGISWSDANTAALRRTPDSHLATTTDAAENEFVFALVNEPKFFPHGNAPWLGGVQVAGAREPDGGWRWVTGEPFVFAAWSFGEPSDVGIEHFLQYANPGRPVPLWNDFRDELAPGYVIESTTMITPIPAAALLLAPALLGLGVLARRQTQRTAAGQAG